MPCWLGFTVSAPPTTWSLIPSFGNAVTPGSSVQSRQIRFVVAEERSRTGAVGRRRGLQPVTPEPGMLDRDRVRAE